MKKLTPALGPGVVLCRTNYVFSMFDVEYALQLVLTCRLDQYGLSASCRKPGLMEYLSPNRVGIESTVEGVRFKSSFLVSFGNSLGPALRVSTMKGGSTVLRNLSGHFSMASLRETGRA